MNQCQRAKRLDLLDAADDLVGVAVFVVVDLQLAGAGAGEVAAGHLGVRRALRRIV